MRHAGPGDSARREPTAAGHPPPTALPASEPLFADVQPAEQRHAGAVPRWPVDSANGPRELSCVLSGSAVVRTCLQWPSSRVRGQRVEPLTSRGRGAEPHVGGIAHSPAQVSAPTPGRLLASSPLFLGGLTPPWRQGGAPSPRHLNRPAAFSPPRAAIPHTFPETLGIWYPDVWLFFYFPRKKNRRKPLPGMSSLVKEKAEPLFSMFIIKK